MRRTGSLRRAGAALLALAGAAAAQTPLSAIEWLRAPPPITVAQPLIRPLTEPPVAKAVTVPEVTVMPLEGVRRDAVGLLPSSTTGLPPALWSASPTARLVEMLGALPDHPPPAVQALIYTLLLAEADPPEDAGEDARFLRARIAALRRYGAVDAALALVERAGPETPGLFDDWLDLALLAGREGAPCAALAARPRLSASYARRIFCLARAGDWPTAALTFDTARALGALSANEAALLAAFLDPESAETPDTPPPREMTPLVFRLYEAVGSPLPTGSLPREYAVADLRGTAGWRAEIEAAERLARSGALPGNRLLGLYTERRPAASGGVWERVRAIQALDAAFESGDRARIAEALPPAWERMREARLGVMFAVLFGNRLAELRLPGAAQAVALDVVLLSPAPAAAARLVPVPPPERRFAVALASGHPRAAPATGDLERAIAAGFAAEGPAPAEAALFEEGRIGEAILQAALRLAAAGRERPDRIETAVASLRAVGLGEAARAAALQILILGDEA